MDLDWAAARLGWEVTKGLTLAGVALYAWWRTRDRVTHQAIAELRDRIVFAEKEIAQRTGFTHLEDLKREVSQTNTQLAQVSAKLEAQTQLLGRVHEWLLQHASDNLRERRER